MYTGVAKWKWRLQCTCSGLLYIQDLFCHVTTWKILIPVAEKE